MRVHDPVNNMNFSIITTIVPKTNSHFCKEMNNYSYGITHNDMAFRQSSMIRVMGSKKEN